MNDYLLLLVCIHTCPLDRVMFKDALDWVQDCSGLLLNPIWYNILEPYLGRLVMYYREDTEHVLPVPWLLYKWRELVTWELLGAKRVVGLYHLLPYYRAFMLTHFVYWANARYNLIKNYVLSHTLIVMAYMCIVVLAFALYMTATMFMILLLTMLVVGLLLIVEWVLPPTRS